VHGTGGQTRAFIHIRDSVKCVELAINNPPAAGEKVRIYNQMTESHKVKDLAEKVAAVTGAKLNHLPNPRKEAIENDLIVDNRCLIELGLKPTTLDEGLLGEVVDVARRWADRCDRSRIPCVSTWTHSQAAALQPVI
jgi:UDP-sulfoquinovose synthase